MKNWKMQMRFHSSYLLAWTTEVPYLDNFVTAYLTESNSNNLINNKN